VLGRHPLALPCHAWSKLRWLHRSLPSRFAPQGCTFLPLPLLHFPLCSLLSVLPLLPQSRGFSLLLMEGGWICSFPATAVAGAEPSVGGERASSLPQLT